MGEKTIYKCPDCEGYFEGTGKNGLIPHILSCHPFDSTGLNILQWMVEGGLPGAKRN